MNPQIIIALITSLAALATAIFTSVRSSSQNRKLESLKAQLEIEKNVDNEKFKFLMTYETDKINQSLVVLKDFLYISQLTKDFIRDLVQHYHNLFAEEISVKVKNYRDDLVQQFSKSFYYLNLIDQNKEAHHIKKLLVKALESLETELNKELLDRYIYEITELQNKLQKDVDSQIDKKLDAFRNRA